MNQNQAANDFNRTRNVESNHDFLDFNPSIQNGLCPCPQFDLFPIAQEHHLRFDKAGVQQGGAKF